MTAASDRRSGACDRAASTAPTALSATSTARASRAWIAVGSIGTPRVVFTSPPRSAVCHASGPSQTAVTRTTTGIATTAARDRWTAAKAIATITATMPATGDARNASPAAPPAAAHQRGDERCAARTAAQAASGSNAIPSSRGMAGGTLPSAGVGAGESRRSPP